MNGTDHAWAAGLWVSGSPPANAATGFAAKRELGAVLRPRDGRKMRRVPLSLIAAIAALIPSLIAGHARAAEPKRVLLIQSFGSAATPFTARLVAFETELVAKMGDRVDLDEVSLDMAHYADRDIQEAIVNYLQKRQAKWPPDLVVPIGSSATHFVSDFRDRLFPETPILYVVDRRLLPPGALEKNAAYLGQEIDVPGLIEDMLQVAPATKNVAVIVGSTPLEHYWEEAVQKAAEPFAGRIKFTYYSDLSFDQMKERVSMLTPDTYIMFVLLVRDAAGVTLNSDDALRRLHAVANAPINSIFDHQLGLGIVGGRLYESEGVGKEAANVASRILNGESVAGISPKLFARLPPRYDWRELQRWKISEKLLPPGSTVLFRGRTVWERDRAWIIGGTSVFLLQALLITGLLANLFRRRRAERSLEESEKRFQTMADAAPVLMWVSGEDKLCTFFNKAWLEFTGRSLEQELGNGWSEGIHPGDVEKTRRTYGSAFDARKPFVMQYRLQRHDGEYRSVTHEGMPRYGPRGNFRGYAGACVDITDLLEKERALHEFEERVVLAAEATHHGVWEVDTTTNELWMSDKARSLFQFDPHARLDETTIQSRVHPDDRASRESAVKHAIETEGEYALEYRVLLPDGTLRWISGRGRCVAGKDGKGKRLIGVSVDVTQQKEAQDLFRLAAEGSRLGVWHWDEVAKKLTWDGATREVFGVSADAEITIDTFYRGLHPDDAERVKQTWRQAFELGLPYQIEFRTQRMDRTIRWVDARGRGSYDESGKPLSMVGVVIDITDRKAAEEEAHRQREQINLLGRVSLLGEMTASLAHELNQPLAAIITNASAGQRFIDRDKGDPETMYEILADVVADARRAHGIIQNVRNTIKKGDSIRRRIDVNELVIKVAHVVRPDALGHSCEVETSLGDNLPPVEGDPIQIQQVLVNLVSNAFDSMRQTPESERKVEISTAGNGDGTVHLSVRDHGTGIRSDAHAQLFDQFFTTKEQGLGMGLAIVRSIVEAHGGKIDAENVSDGGARFHFTLPVAKPGV